MPLFIISLINHSKALVALIDGDEIFVKGMKSLFDERKIPLNQVITDYSFEDNDYSRFSILIVDPYKSEQFNISTIKEIREKSPTTKILSLIHI